MLNNTNLSKNIDEEILDAKTYTSIEEIASYMIQKKKEKEKFMIVNLQSITDKYNEWLKELPMVVPHYAVKCNPDPKILKHLSSLGCHFDCATQGEIDLVLNQLNKNIVSPKSIVYSNPNKKEEMIKYALDKKVYLTVFDSKEELIKLSKTKKSHKIKLLLRIKVENEDSICHLSNKFGCDLKQVPMLLQMAITLNMNVVGVCFHVGSGCKNVKSFKHAFKNTYKVFKIANSLGIKMNQVDIGGGFNSTNAEYDGIILPSFETVAKKIRQSIKKLNEKVALLDPDIMIQYISEPGRFFVSESTSVATCIFLKKQDEEKNIQTLFIDDGIYGSFNNMMYDHYCPQPIKINISKERKSSKKNDQKTLSTIINIFSFQTFTLFI